MFIPNFLMLIGDHESLLEAVDISLHNYSLKEGFTPTDTAFDSLYIVLDYCKVSREMEHLLEIHDCSKLLIGSNIGVKNRFLVKKNFFFRISSRNIYDLIVLGEHYFHD
jgi:hypothetical protein